MLSAPALALARSCPQLRTLSNSHKTVVTSRAGVDVVGSETTYKWLWRGEQFVEPPSTRDARPLRRHGEDLVRHGDAVEEEERARDRLNVLDCFSRRRWLVAVEASTDEPHTSVRDRGQGRGRHAGRAAAAHAARRVIKYALAVLVFPQEHWHLALFAHPSHLHVAVVRGADGVVAGPRALVGAKGAPFVRAPVPVQIEPAWKSTFGRPTNRRDVFP